MSRPVCRAFARHYIRTRKYGVANFPKEFATATNVESTGNCEVKPFSAIPQAKGWPLIGTLLETNAHFGRVHELQLKRYQDLGSIYYENVAFFKMLFISDMQAVEQLFRQEGRYPNRMGIPIWDYYRKQYNHAPGLLLTQGETWQRMRSVIDKPMMRVKDVENYTDDFSQVAEEFVDRLARIRKSDGLVENVDIELFNWALESSCTMLCETRLGALKDNKSQMTTDFVEAVLDMFRLTNKLFYIPPSITKIFFPRDWKAFKNSFDTIFRIAKILIDQTMEKIAKAPEDHVAGFLEQLLSRDTMTLKEVYGNVTDLMAAAVDTTATTFHHFLYEIAKNTDVQEHVFEEIQRNIPVGDLPTAAHFRNMPYLKAAIKETLRLHPTVQVQTRTLTEDSVIMGYSVPAGTVVGVPTYLLGRLPSLYTDPLVFRPGRWVRDAEGQREKINPFSFLSFGFGPRMCVGRRVAEMEMWTLAAQILQRFRLELADDKPLVEETLTVLRPKYPVPVRLIDR